MPDTVSIKTSYGDLQVSQGLVNIWNRYGWPSKILLRRMAAEQGRDKEKVHG